MFCASPFMWGASLESISRSLHRGRGRGCCAAINGVFWAKPWGAISFLAMFAWLPDNWRGPHTRYLARRDPATKGRPLLVLFRLGDELRDGRPRRACVLCEPLIRGWQPFACLLLMPPIDGGVVRSARTHQRTNRSYPTGTMRESTVTRRTARRAVARRQSAPPSLFVVLDRRTRADHCVFE